MKHLSLFSGIGGIDLAAEWAGFQTICFVEIDKYCQKVLRKHWPDVLIIEDVKDVTSEKIREIMAYAESRQPGEQEAGDGREDISRGSKTVADTFNGRCQERWPKGNEQDIHTGNENIRPEIKELRGGGNGITLISGGFPCQPHSVAGKREGSVDKRNLWPEFRRVISDIKPRWVLAENVPGIFSSDAGRFFGAILADLAEMGYSAGWATYGAVDVGALHRRNRVFVVAYSAWGRKESGTEWGPSNQPSKAVALANPFGQGEQQPERIIGEIGRWAGNGNQDVADTGESISRRTSRIGGRKRQHEEVEGNGRRGNGSPNGEWAVEPDVGRVAHGIPSRVDRLKCLGNAVVPQQIYPILKGIVDFENQINFGELEC